ncbi:chemotaxis protein [Vibrio parahaemolyticus]|uniref:chemotaxis protein n=1 Tax=Vibrio parahaemolyticus TaxID=670 RepID=UPI000A39037B|nr:chemotaxis protein [Vibrio parahaemolyticus]OUJ51544.1 chemotaxis protein [Vibrio parahaemolyticus]HCM0698028.1 chemotaxis protein [Vibrio parahaemolyticus]
MSIKQSITSLVILLSVSFSANALVKYSWKGQIKYADSPEGIITQVVGYCGYIPSMRQSQKMVSGQPYGSGSVLINTEYFDGSGCSGSVRKTSSFTLSYTTVASCPDGQVFDPDTGTCDEPPPPFCSRPDIVKQMSDYSQSCSAKGAGYQANIICRDEDEYLDMSCPPPTEQCTPDSSDWPACKDPEPDECTPDSPDWDPRYGTCCRPENNWCDTPEPESCVIGGPNWPACATDTDIDPPTGGDLGDPDKPSGGGTGNPDPDKPEPDVDNTSDTLAAIKSMNSDLNAQLTGINNDMNKNQAETKSALDALKASVDLNTDTVVDNANHVANAIQGQSDMLSDIGNNTNRLLTSANNQLSNGFGQLSSDLGELQETNQQGFDELSDKLDDLKPCVPTPENRFCENPHGLDTNFVGDALTQADSIVSGALSSYESTVVGAANDLLEKNITAESEAHITAVSDSFLNLLPQPSECMRLSLPTLNGGNVSISCEFSHKLKMILSILIYIYTIKTLAEILLTEVTPVPSNKPGSGRYY